MESGADYLFNKGAENDYLPLGTWCDKKGGIVWSGRAAHDAACKIAGISGYNRHKTRQEAILSLYSEIRDLDRIRYIGGWMSRTAFERYYDKGLIEQIEQGLFNFDISWHSEYSAELLRKVA